MRRLTGIFVVATTVAPLLLTALDAGAESLLTPTDDIAIFATMSVSDGNVAGLNEVVARLRQAVRDEPGTLIYEYARSGNTVYLYERYDDMASMMAHVENTGALTGELFALAPITSVVTLTTLPPDLVPVFEQYKAVIAEPIAAGTE